MFVTSLTERGLTLRGIHSIHTEALTVLAVACFTAPECCKYSFICCFIEEFICYVLGTQVHDSN